MLRSDDARSGCVLMQGPVHNVQTDQDKLSWLEKKLKTLQSIGQSPLLS